MNKSAIIYYKHMTIILSTAGFIILLFFVIAQNMEIQHYNELYADLCKGLIGFQTSWNGTTLASRQIPIKGAISPPSKGSFGYGGGIGGGFGLGTYCTKDLPAPSPTLSPTVPTKCTS